MWGIIVKNNGMWGFTAWVKKDGETLTFKSEQEAMAEAKKLNENRSPVNDFNQYFVEKIDD